MGEDNVVETPATPTTPKPKPEPNGKLSTESYVLDDVAHEFTEKEPLRGNTPVTTLKNKRTEVSIADDRGQNPAIRLATIRHLLRYKFISLLAYNKYVLDFGCGGGYGTLLLARNAMKVMGIDAEQPSIDFANRYNKVDNLYYVKQHVENYKPDKVFDLVACVEVIEHIDPTIVNEFVGKMRDSTKDNGVLVFTTPRMQTTTSHQKSPQFKQYHSHFKEYNKYDFTTILERNELQIDQYLLQRWDGSIVYQPPLKATYNVGLRKDHWVQIAVCSKL